MSTTEASLDDQKNDNSDHPKTPDPALMLPVVGPSQGGQNICDVIVFFKQIINYD